MSYKVYICGGDDTMVVPNPDCPNADLHTPHPRNYAEHADWACEQMGAGKVQVRCPGCGLFNIWKERAVEH